MENENEHKIYSDHFKQAGYFSIFKRKQKRQLSNLIHEYFMTNLNIFSVPFKAH